eukprot:tig00000190_g13871.t1
MAFVSCQPLARVGSASTPQRSQRASCDAAAGLRSEFAGARVARRTFVLDLAACRPRHFVVDAALERKKVKKNEEIPQEIVLPDRSSGPSTQPPRTEFKVLPRSAVVGEETEEELAELARKKKKEDEEGTPLAYRIGGAIIGFCLIASSLGPGLSGFGGSKSNDPATLEKSEMRWAEIVEKDPRDSTALRTLINTKVQLKKVEEAMPLLDRLAALDPDDAEVADYHALLLATRGDDIAGLRRLEQYLQRNPFDTNMLQKVEIELQGTGRTGEAVKLAERTVALLADPKDSAALAALNAFYSDAGVAPLGQPKELKRPTADQKLQVRLILGQVYVSDGDFDKAIETFEKLTKDFPKDFRAFIALGSSIELSRPGDAAARAEAQVLYQQARVLNPKEVDKMFAPDN